MCTRIGKLTRMSIPPNFGFNQDASFSTDSELVTSNGWKCTLSIPSLFKFSTAAVPSFSSRAVSTTVRPCCASCFTAARPIPLLPPVTSATVSFVHHLPLTDQNTQICHTMKRNDAGVATSLSSGVASFS